jgi:hypothetical protein
MSTRTERPDDDDDDDEDGRTVVRGAPKVVKRTSPAGASSSPPPSISPAAVIQATLKSARDSRRRDLMPGPPPDLLEDRSDFEQPRGSVGLRSSPPSEGPSSYSPSSYTPAPSSRSGAPPSSRRDVGAGPSSFGAHSQPVSSIPGVAPSSMPAHFMTAQAPYSDPPGTSVTSGHRIPGRPAVSWAAALLACGLFVGVAAVAVVQSSDAAADTTASFVDPSRAPVRNAPATQPAPAPAPTPVPMTPNGVPAAAQAAPQPPPALLGASQPPPQGAPTASVGAGVGGFAPVVGGFAPVAVAPSAPKAAAPKVTWKAAAPPPAKPAAKAAAPTLGASADDEAPKKEAKKPAKRGEPDDETKKALEALQKAQLESASSFGKE